MGDAAVAPEVMLPRSGQIAQLLAARAVWLPRQQCLLVADVHLGKAQAFRRLGVAVPETTTDDILQRLDRLLDHTQAREIVFLGDLLHARHSRSPRLLDAVGAWRQGHAALELTLVRGNHDDRAGDPPAQWGVRVVDEPWCRDGLALCHHPQAVAGHDALAGHLHPAIVIGRGFERLRLPCFHLQPGVAVLPAFGSFTGLHTVTAAPGDRVFAIAGEQVREIAI